MTGTVGKTTNNPFTIMSLAAQAEREDQWGEMPGRVVSFNAETQTATIQPAYRKRLNGVPTDLPELLEVPVRFPRAGGFVITAPVKAGDMVSLRPQMRNTAAFHSGDDFTADDTRSFSLSDMEAFLDGGEPLSSPIPNFNASNMEMRSADGQFAIEMSEDGKFKMRGAEGNAFALIAEALQLLGSDTLSIKYGSSAGSGHALEHRDAVLAIATKLKGMAL